MRGSVKVLIGIIAFLAVIGILISIENVFSAIEEESISLAPSQTCVPPPSGLVSWWPGDGTADDIAGAFDGTLQNGATFAPGKVDEAFRLDGVNDWVNTGAVYPSIADNFTMEFWANPLTTRATTSEANGGVSGIGGQRYAIFPQHSGGVGGGHAGAGVSVGTNGISVFEHADNYLPSLLVYDTPLSGWNHVTVVYINKQPQLYLNGQLVRTGLTSGYIVHPSGYIGEVGSGYGYYMGLIDEVEIYNRSLNSSEIQSLFNADSAGKCGKPLKITTNSFLPLNELEHFSSHQFNATGGLPPYSWSLANSSLPPGMELHPDGILNGTPTEKGIFVFILNVTDSLNFAANKTFTKRIGELACLSQPSGLASWWPMDEGTDRLTPEFVESIRVDGEFDNAGAGTAIKAVDSTIYIGYHAPSANSLKVAKSVDSGTTWNISTVTSPSCGGPRIDAPDSNTIFLIYGCFSFLNFANSSNGGANWNIKTIAAPLGMRAADIDAVDNNTIYIAFGYVVGSDNMALDIAKSTDGGATWTTAHILQNLFSISSVSLHALNSSTVYLAADIAGNIEFLKSTDGGSTWARVSVFNSANSPSLKALDSDTIFIAFNGGVLSFAKSTNAGATWNNFQLVGIPASYISMDAIDPKTIFVSHYDGSNLRLTKTADGAIWKSEILDGATTNVGEFSSLDALDTNNVFVSYYDRTNGDLKFTKSKVGFTAAVTTAQDIADANPGTLSNGPVWAFGNVNGSIAFDGIDDLVNVPSNANLNPSNITVAAWVKTTDSGVSKNIVVKTTGCASSGYIMWLNENGIPGPGKPGFWIGGTWLDSDVAINDGQWHHVAGTFNGTTASIYVDGVLRNRGPRAGSLVSSNPLQIGRSTYCGSAFNGQIDELQIFNRSLNDSEILDIYLADTFGLCGRPFCGDSIRQSSEECDDGNNINGDGCSAACIVETCVEPPSGLTRWWTGDGNTLDFIGGDDGFLANGATFTSGKVGQAFAFDGMDDYFVLPPQPVSSLLNTTFTIDFWASSGSLSDVPTFGFLGSGSFSDNPLFSHDGFPFNPTAIVVGNGISPQALTPYMPTVSEAWTHYAFVDDGTSYKLYINGALHFTHSIAVNPASNRDRAFAIGQSGLVVGAVGDTFQFNGAIDEFEIYDRGLSHAEIQAIYNSGSAGKCKALRIRTESLPINLFREFSSHQFDAIGGTPPYSWSLVSGSLPAGMTLHPNGVLNGTPNEAGNFTFTVRATDGENNSSERTFTKQVLLGLPQSTITIHKFGTTPVPGRVMDYFIQIYNGRTVCHRECTVGSGGGGCSTSCFSIPGEVTAQNILVTEFLQPWFLLVSANPTPIEIRNADFNKTGLVNNTPENLSLVVWNVPILAPNEVKIISYKVKLSELVPLSIPVKGGPGCTEGGGAAIEDILLECGEGLMACVDFFREKICPERCKNVIPEMVRDICKFFPTGPASETCGLCEVACTAGGITECELDYFECLTDVDCYDDEDEPKNAIDPNEKGAIANKFIPPGQLLPYVIHFENIGNVSALDVFVNDTLDQSLNLSTINVFIPNSTFVPLSPNGTVILLEREKNKTIIIDPQTNLTVNITISEKWTVALLNRTLYWNLSGIDLEPNATGEVIYSILPNSGLLSGTNITNNATIQFEIFESLTTNSTLNIIDGIVPSCTIQPLPSLTITSNITLYWDYVDTVGEADFYTIFASVDGGGFAPLINRTTDMNATINVTSNTTYSFICITRDTAGNTEIQDPIAEASTYVNLPPILDPVGNRAVDENQTLIIQLNATDPENDALIFGTDAGSVLPSSFSFNPISGLFSWTPTFDDAGEYLVMFNVSDGFSTDEETINITVNNVNRAPALDPVGDKVVNENQMLTIQLNATDPDNDNLIFGTNAGNVLPGTFNFDPNTGFFEWFATFEDAGSYLVTFNVSDGQLSDEETIVITIVNVNRAPVLNPIGNQTVNESEKLSFRLNATDPDNDTLYFGTDAGSVLPEGALWGLNSITGLFTWYTTFDDAGNYTVYFSVRDRIEYPYEADDEIITITVNNVNRAPVLDPIGDKIVNENELLTIQLNASDPDNDILVFGTNAGSVLPSPFSFNPNSGLFEWTPTFEDAGIYSVTFNVTDSGFPAEETIIITVVNVNRPPVLASVGNKVVTETQTLLIQLSASDPDGELLVFGTNAYDILPSSFSFNLSTGLFNWTPQAGDAGNYIVSFNVSDGDLADNETITIMVNPLNRAPVLEPVGNKITNEGQTLIIQLIANDPDNQILTFGTNASSVLPSPFNFNTTTGFFNWTPTFDDAGEYFVTFNVTDGELSDEEVITITVNDVNRAPVLNPIGNKQINATQNLLIQLSATDPDLDILIFGTNASLVLPSSFLFSPATGLFNWTPKLTEDGNYSVLFNVTDGLEADRESILISVLDICGDPNRDGKINLQDIIYVVNYVFKGGPAPSPLLAGDANNDGKVNLQDIIYLVNYVFKGGPKPCA